MKKIILSAVCIIAAILANAQTPTFEWAKNMGGFGQDAGYAIALDGSGNILTTGSFAYNDSVGGSGDFDPGPGTFNLTSRGYEDIFISKLDPLGNFMWAKSFGNGLYRSTAVYHANGERRDTRTPVTRNEMPRNIFEPIYKSHPGTSLEDIIKIEVPNAAKDIFRIKDILGGKPTYFYYNSDGHLVKYNY